VPADHWLSLALVFSDLVFSDLVAAATGDRGFEAPVVESEPEDAPEEEPDDAPVLPSRKKRPRRPRSNTQP
jgi:hypothetical protein